MIPRPNRWRWMWLSALILSGNVNAMYCSQEGRFLQQDPMGYEDGLNLYEYVRSFPIVSIDPFGMFTIEPMNKPLWKKGNTNHKYMDGAYMGVFLFPDEKEKRMVSSIESGASNRIETRATGFITIPLNLPYGQG